jgi:hypothetical protein
VGWGVGWKVGRKEERKPVNIFKIPLMVDFTHIDPFCQSTCDIM